MADPRPAPLDLAPTRDVVDAVLAAQARAVAAVQAAAEAIAEAVELVCGRCATGGRLLVVGDGTAARVVDLAVTGVPTDFGFTDAAVQALTAAGLRDARPTARDAVVVVALDAGPDVRAALDLARRARSALVVVTTVSTATTGDDGLGAAGDVTVGVAVGPEVVRGVRRLAAAGAAKLVLDALTTGVAARLGRVHGDLPVDLVAGSDDDRDRVVTMVAELTGLPEAAARAGAEAAGFDVRTAVVAHAGGLTTAQAAMHASGRRTLRDALAKLPPPLPG